MMKKLGPAIQTPRQIRRRKALQHICATALSLFLLALGISAAAEAQLRSNYPVRRNPLSTKLSPASAYQVRQHVLRAKAQALTPADVATFGSNLQNLVNWLAKVPTNNPLQSAQVNDLQAQINGMTSDEMTQLAQDTDVVAFNTAVSTITTVTAAQRTLPPSDPPASLFPPQYGICAPTNGPPTVPSDPGVDQALLITIEVLTGVHIVADDLENLNIEIAGEENNTPFIIAAIVVDEILNALQIASDQIQFCDPYDEAAEVEAGWQNTIVIDTDLANLSAGTATQFNLLQNQITAINTDVDNHISTISGTDNNEFPQINTQLTAFSTNMTHQEQIVDVDIDNHLAVVSSDLTNNLASLNADIANTTTAITTDIANHATQVNTDLLNRDTKIDGEVATTQTLDVRLEIEHALTGGLSVGIFELPLSQGGFLETLRAIVSDAISKLLGAGQPVGTATKSLALGDTAYASKQYKAAYYDYMSAYQTAVN